ncbi:MAG: metallophosphoesterase [Bacteroidota bacterium]
MNRILVFSFLIFLSFLLDFYVFNALRGLFDTDKESARKYFTIVYWSITVLLMIAVLIFSQVNPKGPYNIPRLVVISAFSIVAFGKFLASAFLFIDDLRRGITYLSGFLPFIEGKSSVSRSDFLTKSTVLAGAVPILTMTYGIISGAHDYRVRKRSIQFKNLPKEFDGIRIAQISDIHTGSFYNKVAVEGGVDLLLNEKPDITLFTGDLVNSKSEEAKDYLDIFKRIKSPLGVYSVKGNHDYGDYMSWPSAEAKRKDQKQLREMHAYMEYDLLLNEHRRIKVDGAEIGILGCENWGTGRFAKYGKLKETTEGTEDLEFKILMSHDPSHWDAQIIPEYSNIDLTLSGHTHGMQFGIEIGDFRWSPVKWRYKQWADLHQNGNQYLYVNRGYGFIGYPGRIGILPEITIFELKRG